MMSRDRRGEIKTAGKSHRKKDEFGDSQKAEVYEIWEATPAAPSFFPPAQVGDKMYYDAAIGCKNPSFEAYSET
jgi:hypothetical protein